MYFFALCCLLVVKALSPALRNENVVHGIPPLSLFVQGPSVVLFARTPRTMKHWKRTDWRMARMNRLQTTLTFVQPLHKPWIQVHYVQMHPTVLLACNVPDDSCFSPSLVVGVSTPSPDCLANACVYETRALTVAPRKTTDPSRGGGFTPPESPRAGAMRGPSGSFNGGQGGSMQHQGPPRGVASPGGGGGGGGGGLGSAGMPRPGDRIRTNSPHSSNRGIAGYAAGGGRSSRPSWTMPRPNTSRGGSGNGAAGDRVSPMLRPRDGQGHSSHSVTPSPTFSAQQEMTGGRFAAKRPETPLEVRGYYSSRNASPGNRSSGAGGRTGARSSSFFPSSKAGLF
ncbi:unnamed protein product [Ectocarpus sp. 4 AP-2014]